VDGGRRSRGEFLFYVKVCDHCGYSESFSKFHVDAARGLDERGGFGSVTRNPTGGVILSFFVPEYRTPHGRATDFSIPLSAEQWFAVQTAAQSLNDDDLVREVFGEAYLQAWKKRVGEFPRGFASQLRDLIEHSDPEAR